MSAAPSVNASGKAGRDVLSTLYAEYLFRRGLVREFAISMNDKPINEPSVRESFAVNSYEADQTGTGSMYILSSGTRDLDRGLW